MGEHRCREEHRPPLGWSRGYLGISYAYLERGGIATPVMTPGGVGPDVLDRSSGLNPVVLNPTQA